MTDQWTTNTIETVQKCIIDLIGNLGSAFERIIELQAENEAIRGRLAALETKGNENVIGSSA